MSSQEPQLIIIQEVCRSPYSSTRDESDYQIIHRSDTVDDRRLSRRDYNYQNVYCREISPHSSLSHRHDHQYHNYSSDDEMMYVDRRSSDYQEESPHRKRHIAEGALVGVEAAEMFQYYQKKRGDPPLDTLTQLNKDLASGALGAVAGGAISRARSQSRSKSRRRTKSLDRDLDRGHRHDHQHLHRRRSSSHSRTIILKTVRKQKLLIVITLFVRNLI
jgi:hypothetical protein